MTRREAGDSFTTVTESTRSESIPAFLARIIFEEPTPPRGDLDQLRARLKGVGANDAPTEDAALRSVVYLLDMVLTGLHAGTASHDPSFWERVQEAHDLVADFKGDLRKRSRVIEAIDWAVEHWQDRRGLDPSVRNPSDVWYGVLLTTLTYCDARFERLHRDFAISVIDEVAALTPEEKRKHGRGLLDVKGAAARLAVKVGAFGDVDEAKAAQAFRNASRTAKPPDEG